MVFEHPLPSAYSSSRFAEYMASMRGMRCLMVGMFAGRNDPGDRRGRDFTAATAIRCVSDAVACRQPGTAMPPSYKQSVVNVIGNFATVHASAELIRTSGAIAV